MIWMDSSGGDCLCMSTRRQIWMDSSGGDCLCMSTRRQTAFKQRREEVMVTGQLLSDLKFMVITLGEQRGQVYSFKII